VDEIDKSELRLDQFLKLSSLTGSGGGAKFLIQKGQVRVNGETETRRRRKLAVGDIIEVNNQRLIVPESMF